LNSYTPLQKNELLAAQWTTEFVEWNSVEVGKHTSDYLTTHMAARLTKTYEAQKEYFEYEVNIEPLDETKLELYDLIYALSMSTAEQVKEMGKTFMKPVLRPVFRFSESALNDVAFEVLGLFLLKRKPAPLVRIPQKLPLGNIGKHEVTGMIKSYIEACDKVEDALNEFAAGNSKYFQNSKPLGIIQAIVYIAGWMALTRNHKFETLSGKVYVDNEGEIPLVNIKKRWKQCLPAWWLLDSIDGTFVGSDANTNAVKRVWNDENPTTTVCSQPKLSEFERAFVQTFLEESVILDKAPVRRVQTDRARAIMHAAFLNESLTSNAEADHVIPWKKKAGATAALIKPLPLNHVGNWMPLEKTINTSRSNIPWAEHYEQLGVGDKKKISQRLLLKSSDFSSAASLDLDSFIILMLRRYQLLVDRCLFNTKVEEYISKSDGQRHEWIAESIRRPIVKQLKDVGYAIDEEDVIISVDLMIS
jgi:hypothetical protein